MKSTVLEVSGDLERVSGEAVKQLKSLNKSDPSAKFKNNLEGQTGCQSLSKRAVGILLFSLKNERGGHLCIALEDTPIGPEYLSNLITSTG